MRPVPGRGHQDQLFLASRLSCRAAARNGAIEITCFLLLCNKKHEDLQYGQMKVRTTQKRPIPPQDSSQAGRNSRIKPYFQSRRRLAPRALSFAPAPGPARRQPWQRLPPGRKETPALSRFPREGAGGVFAGRRGSKIVLRKRYSPAGSAGAAAAGSASVSSYSCQQFFPCFFAR